MDTLLIDRRADGVTVLTLNRPAVMNALDMATAERLGEALGECAANATTRCLVLTGAGDRAFCAGNDIGEMGGMDADAMLAAFVARDPLTWQVASHPKPVIAALNGIAYGAGALIAMAADIRIGCPASRLKVTASGYGGANATWTLPRIVGAAKAKEILFTGRAVEADEALEIGLLNVIAPAGGALDAALAMGAAIAANDPVGVQGLKRLIDDGQARTPGDGFRAEFNWMAEATRRGGASGAEVFAGFLGRKDKPNA